MMESPTIIKMNIAHYEALLKSGQPLERRADIEHLLAEAKAALASATRLGEQEAPHAHA